MNQLSSIDLTNCDKERIHEIGSIQGHGAFIAVSPLDLKIHFASENIGAFFSIGDNVHTLLGRKLTEVISHELAMEIQTRIRSGQVGPLKQARFGFRRETNLDIYMFQLRDGIFGIEFEKLDEDATAAIPSEEVLNQFVKKMQECKSLNEISKESCRAVRALTGMDRVMVYRFFPPTMYGEVIAEDKTASVQTFMSHRFPATDIPKPARDLYYRNHVRFIFNSHEGDHKIYPSSDKQPLDMSDSRLRGVSKIHLEYLRNMEVSGSFSIAIIVDKVLWGIIACHSKKPIHISHSIRAMCETISNSLAMGASLFEKLSLQIENQKFFDSMYTLFGKLYESKEPQDILFREGNDVLKLFNCSGFVFVSSQKIDLFGLTPLPDDIKKIWAWTLAKMDNEGKDIVCTDSLSSYRKEFESVKDQASGIIVIRLNELNDDLFMLFRPEFLETIYWGGDPRKNLEERRYNGMINPRASFETWSEVVKNTSVAWKENEVKGIKYFKHLIFDSLVAKESLINELHDQLKKYRP